MLGNANSQGNAESTGRHHFTPTNTLHTGKPETPGQVGQGCAELPQFPQALVWGSWLEISLAGLVCNTDSCDQRFCESTGTQDLRQVLRAASLSSHAWAQTSLRRSTDGGASRAEP